MNKHLKREFDFKFDNHGILTSSGNAFHPCMGTVKIFETERGFLMNFGKTQKLKAEKNDFYFLDFDFWGILCS